MGGRDLWGFGAAGEAPVGLRGLAVRGGNEGDELICGGFCERRTQARRSERDWRCCAGSGFLLRRAARGEGKRRCEAGSAATVMRCRS